MAQTPTLERVTEELAAPLECLGLWARALDVHADATLAEILRRQDGFVDPVAVTAAIGLQISVALLATQLAYGLMRGAPEAVLTAAVSALGSYLRYVRGTSTERIKSDLASDLSAAMRGLREHCGTRVT